MNLRDKIPPEKMAEITDDLIEMGVKAVTFSGGGEPLIYPRFAEAVEKLASGGIQVAALTNGSRLTGWVAEALATHATWVRISIDGWDGKSYARYRDVKEDAFEKVLANIAAFTRLKSRCVVGASIIVDRDNASRIYELADRLKAAGVSHAKISPCIVSNSGAENNSYHESIQGTVRQQIENAAWDFNDDHFRIVDHYHQMEEKFSKDYSACPFAQYLTVIAADLKVYTCQDKAYTESGLLGSIAETRFKDFWFSEENRKALAAIDPRCHCDHHCVAEPKNRLLNELLDTDAAHAAFV
jgi:MoaA/NifB/PqqE/SkfB family radical SAM enzyme